MDRLHPHIVVNIVQQAVSGPEPQLELLAVCSEFYLAAIPILYHSPRIDTLSQLESFSLFTSRPLPKMCKSLSVRELVKAGHTKLAALRCTRHLCIAITGLDVYHPHGMLEIKQEHKKALSNALYQKFCKLPGGAMPNLETLQVVDLKRNPIGPEGIVVNLVGANMAEAIMARGCPRVWCQHLAQIIPAEFPRHDPELWEYYPNPPTLHCHTYPFNHINLFPGKTSYVYVHPDLHTRPRNPDQADWEEGLVWWLAGAISSAFEIVESAYLPRGDNRKKLIKRSRIVIAFAPGILGEPGLDAEEELGRLRKIAERAIEAASSPEDEQPDLKDVTIDVRSESDMPRCPACRLNVGDIWYVPCLLPFARAFDFVPTPTYFRSFSLYRQNGSRRRTAGLKETPL